MIDLLKCMGSWFFLFISYIEIGFLPFGHFHAVQWNISRFGDLQPYSIPLFCMPQCHTSSCALPRASMKLRITESSHIYAFAQHLELMSTWERRYDAVEFMRILTKSYSFTWNGSVEMLNLSEFCKQIPQESSNKLFPRIQNFAIFFCLTKESWKCVSKAKRNEALKRSTFWGNEAIFRSLFCNFIPQFFISLVLEVGGRTHEALSETGKCTSDYFELSHPLSLSLNFPSSDLNARKHTRVWSARPGAVLCLQKPSQAILNLKFSFLLHLALDLSFFALEQIFVRNFITHIFSHFH